MPQYSNNRQHPQSGRFYGEGEFIFQHSDVVINDTVVPLPVSSPTLAYSTRSIDPISPVGDNSGRNYVLWICVIAVIGGTGALLLIRLLKSKELSPQTAKTIDKTTSDLNMILDGHSSKFNFKKDSQTVETDNKAAKKHPEKKEQPKKDDDSKKDSVLDKIRM